MNRLMLMVALLLPLSAFADISSNPFLKPEVRNPPEPAVQQTSPSHPLSPSRQVIEPEANEDITRAQEPVEGTLIAVINGEEVWLKKEDKTYINQQARDESRIRLQESNSQSAADSAEDPIYDELPRASTGRTSPSRTR